MKKYELIVTITDRGNSQIIMDTARSVGATGGTIIHGKGTGNEKVEKFFGITIQPEKEIIFILSPIDNKEKIMKAINEKTGLREKIQGICFSLPVEDTIGLENKSIVELLKEKKN